MVFGGSHSLDLLKNLDHAFEPEEIAVVRTFVDDLVGKPAGCRVGKVNHLHIDQWGREILRRDAERREMRRITGSETVRRGGRELSR